MTEEPKEDNQEVILNNEYQHTFLLWFGLQVLVPLLIAIMMWYPMAQVVKGVPFSFERSFASGDLSLFSSLLFFGVLAEIYTKKERNLWMTTYLVVSIAAGILSLLIFMNSKTETLSFDFPKTAVEAIPHSVYFLSLINFIIGIFSVVFVTAVTLDIKRRP
jgi:hypothetical protein